MTEIGIVLDGKYEILKLIGKGGMSYVYLSIDNRLKKQWAIKELRSKGKELESLLNSLVHEANILKKIDHPVIPRIVDILNEQGTIYVVMDYVEGRTLDEIVKKEGPQPEELVIEWGIQLAEALNYLHSMKPPVIYRDMKPSNVMLKPDGSIKLIDFGTAKEFHAENIADTTALGTRGYAAPEQFGDAGGRGKYNTDARTDIYSLGATLYQLVTGKSPSEPPYEIRPIREWFPSLSQGLEKIILKCTEADPNKRYENCMELVYDLEHYNEMDRSYRKKQIKKLLVFLCSVSITIGCAFLSQYGVKEKKRVEIKEYKTIVNQAQIAIMNQQYEEGIKQLKIAIEQIDSTRPEAYEALLGIYEVQNNIDMGLQDICWYIDNYEEKKKPSDEIILDVVKRYFNNQNYKKCYQYATMVEEMEEAKYYKNLSRILSSMHIGVEKYKKELKEFENFNNTLQENKNKLDNYKSLVMVYTTSFSMDNETANNVIELCKKAFDILEKDEFSEEVSYNIEEYQVIFCEYISRAYEMKMELATNRKRRQVYSKEVLFYCDTAISLLSDEVKSERGKKINLLLKVCKVYMEIKEYEKAKTRYQNMLKNYSQKENVDNVYINYMKLLCQEQKDKTTDVKKWDLSEIRELYRMATGKNQRLLENTIWNKLLADIGTENLK